MRAARDRCPPIRRPRRAGRRSARRLPTSAPTPTTAPSTLGWKERSRCCTEQQEREQRAGSGCLRTRFPALFFHPMTTQRVITLLAGVAAGARHGGTPPPRPPRDLLGSGGDAPSWDLHTPPPGPRGVTGGGPGRGARPRGG